MTIAKRAASSPQMDTFAEHLAEGLSARAAAGRMGLEPGTGDKMLQRLRKIMGAQAA